MPRLFAGAVIGLLALAIFSGAASAAEIKVLTAGAMRGVLVALVPQFEKDTRSYLTVAFGCTGGRHRSVYLAEKLAEHCREHGRSQVVTFHRELE